MSDMLERVAIAIQSVPILGEPQGLSIGHARLMARKAIEAMRDPSDEMVRVAAGCATTDLAGDDEFNEHHIGIWQAMTDAALGEAKR